MSSEERQSARPKKVSKVNGSGKPKSEINVVKDTSDEGSTNREILTKSKTKPSVITPGGETPPDFSEDEDDDDPRV